MQILLLEYTSEAGSAAATERGSLCALMLAVLDGGFRASLQGSPEDELQFCFESSELCLLPSAPF
jgi:hypothetical protein